jgi:CRISPR-associated protein Cmr1
MLLTEPTPFLKALNDGDLLKVRGASKVVGEGARYLGYGVMDAFNGKKTKAGRLVRGCLQAPFEFTVRLRIRELKPPASESLTNALVTLGTLGGMGAKSRKGYGSLVLQTLHVDGGEQWRRPRTAEELRERITSLVGGKMDGPADFPEYTALSAQSRHLVLASNGRQPLELLNVVGSELLRYRSWGHNGKVLGVKREANFKDDHDLMKKDWDGRSNHPRRIAFGLPHNYGPCPNQQVGPYDRQLDRRASPLFIHLHECNDAPVAVLSFLPARFLPKGKPDISVGGKRIRQEPESDLYRPICDFLDRLLCPDKRKEEFAEVVEVP